MVSVYLCTENAAIYVGWIRESEALQTHSEPTGRRTNGATETLHYTTALFLADILQLNKEVIQVNPEANISWWLIEINHGIYLHLRYCAALHLSCVCSIMTKIVTPHSNVWSPSVGLGGEAGFGWAQPLHEVSAEIKKQRSCSLDTTSTTFEHSSVALENIWRGREKERNPRHKHVEPGELTGAGGQPANRSCGFQECAQTHRLSITLSAGYHLCSHFLCLSVSPATCRRLKVETDDLEPKTAECKYFVPVFATFVWDNFFLPKGLKGTVWHLGKYAYSLSCQEQNKKIDTTRISVVNIKLEPAAG